MATEYISTYSHSVYIKPEVEDENTFSIANAKLSPIEAIEVNVNRKQLFRTDKTGFRSRTAIAGPQREEIQVKFNANATGWTDRSGGPVLSPVLESALASRRKTGKIHTVDAVNANTISVQSESQLLVGSGLSFGDEIRFVKSILNERTFELSSAFTAPLSAGSMLLGCCDFRPGSEVQTFGIFEFWRPATAVQRALNGVCADRTTIEINSDFVSMSVVAFAKSMADSVSANTVTAPFPSAPVANPSEISSISPISGHLGQALVGSSGQRVCTIVQGRISIDNGIEARSDEFGCYGAKAFTLGRRRVDLDLYLYERTDEVSRNLFEGAIRNEPTSVMLQLGVGQGNMMGIYLPVVLMPVPIFVDSDSRVLWRFKGAIATGLQDDELFISLA